MAHTYDTSLNKPKKPRVHFLPWHQKYTSYEKCLMFRHSQIFELFEHSPMKTLNFTDSAWPLTLQVVNKISWAIILEYSKDSQILPLVE